MTDKGKYTIDILDVALDVIECLMLSGGKPLRASEIANQLTINRTRVFRILKTLEERGYSAFNPDTQGFRLGLKFLEINKEVLKGFNLRKEVEPILVDLAISTGDSSFLFVREGSNAIIIDRHQGERSLQVYSFIGQSLPLHVGASPKVLLAYTSEEVRENIIKGMLLQRFTANTITRKTDLRHRLDEVRANGYAVDEEDYEIGCFSIGAPVFDTNGSIIAGISISTPGSRYSPQRKQELIELVTGTARKASARMGWTGDK
ncbi:MAG: IclR family transcriptional regulator [Chloroflexi bacterium]|nr:IclR family transcriptional regulator [Chloroflexota bacterium]